MIEAFGYDWLRPAWLILVPVALVLGAVVVSRTARLGDWERAVDPDLLATMRRMGRVRGGRVLRNWLPALVAAVLGIALAGPAVERSDRASYRNLDAVILALDLSPSVVNGGRLFDLLTAARLIAESAGTRQIALIVFSGEAYMAMPPTSDRAALVETIALLDGETVPVAGSRPEEALRLAARTLRDAKILSADVVVLSDGGGSGTAAIAEAARLADLGARVSVVGTEGGVDHALARAGQGLAASLVDPYPVVRQVAARPVERLTRTGFALLALEDRGRHLLWLALLPAILLLPRGRRT